jgi:hypothetical protein
MGNTRYKRRGRKEPAVQHGGEQPVKLKDRSTRLVTIFLTFVIHAGCLKLKTISKKDRKDLKMFFAGFIIFVTIRQKTKSFKQDHFIECPCEKQNCCT